MVFWIRINLNLPWLWRVVSAFFLRLWRNIGGVVFVALPQKKWLFRQESFSFREFFLPVFVRFLPSFWFGYSWIFLNLRVFEENYPQSAFLPSIPLFIGVSSLFPSPLSQRLLSGGRGVFFECFFRVGSLVVLGVVLRLFLCGSRLGFGLQWFGVLQIGFSVSIGCFWGLGFAWVRICYSFFIIWFTVFYILFMSAFGRYFLPPFLCPLCGLFYCFLAGCGFAVRRFVCLTVSVLSVVGSVGGFGF